MTKFFHVHFREACWSIVILLTIAAMMICSGLNQNEENKTETKIAATEFTPSVQRLDVIMPEVPILESELPPVVASTRTKENTEEKEVEFNLVEEELAEEFANPNITSDSVTTTQPVISTAVPESNSNGSAEINKVVEYVEEQKAIEEETEEETESVAETSANDYSYLLDIPYVYTSSEFIYVDNSGSDGLVRDASWLPGLKVSEITADCLTLPDEYTEQDLVYLATMLTYECISVGNDEMAIYTGGAFMNRTIHPEWFPSGFYDNLVRRGQYNTKYVSDSGIAYAQSLSTWNRAVRDALLCMNWLADMPDNVIYQANFKQGGGIWKEIHVDTGYFSSDNYYCYQ